MHSQTSPKFGTAQKKHNQFKHWNNKRYIEESRKEFIEESGKCINANVGLFEQYMIIITVVKKV